LDPKTKNKRLSPEKVPFGSATEKVPFGSAITAYSYTDRQPMARKYDIFLD